MFIMGIYILGIPYQNVWKIWNSERENKFFLSFPYSKWLLFAVLFPCLFTGRTHGLSLLRLWIDGSQVGNSWLLLDILCLLRDCLPCHHRKPLLHPTLYLFGLLEYSQMDCVNMLEIMVLVAYHEFGIPFSIGLWID